LASTLTAEQERRKAMKATMLYGPRDIRFEDRDDPKILNRPTLSFVLR